MNKIHKPQQTLPPTHPVFFTAWGGGHTKLYIVFTPSLAKIYTHFLLTL